MTYNIDDVSGVLMAQAGLVWLGACNGCGWL